MAWTNITKNSSTFDHREKSGWGGQEYDDALLTYDALIDPEGGAKVYYDTTGSLSSFSNQTRNSSVFTNLTKN
jgi:hypothetical protein